MNIYLAGGESWWRTFAKYGIRNILLSYHYLRTQRDFAEMVDWMREAKAKGHEDGPYRFILDSGAFTLMGEDADEGEELNKYANEYIAFLRDSNTLDLWDIIAELDVYVADPTMPEVTPWDRVENWREQLYAIAGSRIMTVVHRAHNKAGINALLTDRRYKYVGVASDLVGADNSLHRMKWVIARSHEREKLVHGFGMTRLQTDMKWLRNMDSVDSTSVGPDTLVWTQQEGNVTYGRIEDLWEAASSRGTVERIGDHYEVVLDGAFTPTALDDGAIVWAPMHSVSRHQVTKPCYRIETETGRELVVTHDHSLFRMDADGAFIETTPDDLTVGEWIVAAARVPWRGNGVPFWEGKIDMLGPGGRREATLDTTILFTADLLEFIGLWIAEGSFSHRTGVQLSNVDQECIKLIERVARTYATTGAHHTYKGKDHLINSRILGPFMQRYLEHGAHNKALPSWFWNLSRGQACAVLRGLFSGDGGSYVNGNRQTIRYFTHSRTLALQLQAALLALLDGPFTLAQHGEKYVITIGDYNTLMSFQREIGFLQARKMLDYEPRGSARRDLPYGLPTELAQSPLIYPDSRGVRVRAERVGRWAHESFNATVANPDLCFLRIRKIERLPDEERWVYDVSVDVTHKFVANGIVAHQTWLRADKYGGTFIYHQGHLRILNHLQKDMRSFFKGYFRRIGLDPDKILGVHMDHADNCPGPNSTTPDCQACRDQLHELRASSLIAWRNLTVRYERMRWGVPYASSQETP